MLLREVDAFYFEKTARVLLGSELHPSQETGPEVKQWARFLQRFCHHRQETGNTVNAVVTVHDKS
jgi:hypothetical protein